MPGTANIEELKRVNEELKEARRAALNLMEDAISSKETLRLSEEKYRTLFDSMDEGYCIIQMIYNVNGKAVDFRYLQVNRAFELNNGLYNAEGRTIREMAPDIEQKWIDIYNRVAESREPVRFEEASAALKRIFSLYAFPIARPEDRKIAVIFTDITARKLSEEALHVSEETLRASEIRLKELNEELEQRVLERTAELIKLKLSQEKEKLNAVIFAQEQERTRIGEGLHNGVAQLLYAAQNRIQLLQPATKEEVEELRTAIAILTDAIRDTRRISFELMPPVLKDFGLQQSLNNFVQRVFAGHMRVELDVKLPMRLTEELEIAVYRISQEILNNILRHSHATQATLRISLTKNHIQLNATDNGQGFNVKSKHKGTGLRSMGNRVQLLDGQIKVTSKEGQGTTVKVKLPLTRNL